jgi:hypothetical protein
MELDASIQNRFEEIPANGPSSGFGFMEIVATCFVEDTTKLCRGSVLGIPDLDGHADRKLRWSAQEGIENLAAVRAQTTSEFLAEPGHLGAVEGGGVRRPKDHDDDFIEARLSQTDYMVLAEAIGGDSGNVLAERVEASCSRIVAVTPLDLSEHRSPHYDHSETAMSFETIAQLVEEQYQPGRSGIRSIFRRLRDQVGRVGSHCHGNPIGTRRSRVELSFGMERQTADSLGRTPIPLS